jgi:YggT family protein
MSIVVGIIARVIDLYSLLILAAIVLSWIQVDPTQPIVAAIRQVTEPPLLALRRALPFLVVGGLDLTPMALLFGLQFLSNSLQRLAYSLS